MKSTIFNLFTLFVCFFMTLNLKAQNNVTSNDVMNTENPIENTVSTCSAPSNFTAQWLTSTSVQLSWVETGTATQWKVGYGVLGTSLTMANQILTTSNPVVIFNLDPMSNYYFYVQSYCGSPENMSAQVTTRLCSINNCIDYTDFASTYCTCYYGDFDNPYETQWIMNLGPASADSRHTVHTDVTETDPRTGNLLKTVYPGACNSVRLGNWNTGAEAEAIRYRLIVDTAQYGILLLNYAAVLEDPSHTAAAQPRLKIEILNTSNQLLDAVCGQRDFIANAALGWNAAPGNVLWKNWTTVGLDISAYHGQSIFIRLTTYDCDYGAHYGYAYFTLACAPKEIQIAGCGTGQKTMTAPSGFTYKWYNNNNPTNVLSTNQSITVTTDGSSYSCKCTSTENTACYFTLSATAEPRYPVAHFTYDYDTAADCSYSVNLINTSLVSSSMEDEIVTGDVCDSYLWDFGDTTTSETSPSMLLKPGMHNITLYTYLAECADSTSLSLFLPPLYADTAYHTDTICVGTEYNQYGFNIDSTQTTAFIFSDTLRLLSAGGCDSTSILTLNINHAPAPSSIVGETTMTMASELFNGRYNFSILPVPGATSYEWSLTAEQWNGAPWPMEVSADGLNCTVIAISPNQNVIIMVKAFSECGVGSFSTRLTASPDGIDEASARATILPNPTTGVISIDAGFMGKSMVMVYNTSSVLIDSFEAIFDNNSPLTYTLNQPDGIYFICIQNENSKIYKKVVLCK